VASTTTPPDATVSISSASGPDPQAEQPADQLACREVKKAMRARVRAERRARTPRQRALDAESLAAVVRELPEVAAARCVAAYASMPTEPGTGPLRAALRRVGIRVLLPVVLDDGTLDWADDDGGELLPARRFGGPEPTGPRLGRDAVRLADLLLVPALAVDSLGNRLGQGAGYYDRALPLVDPSTCVFAVVHDNEVQDAAVEPVPVEPHDLPVHGIVTPQRCLRLPHRPAIGA
jgi:5-formyltetrahydrofolate cyclo-ligase